MIKSLWLPLLICTALICSSPAFALPGEFSFGVIAHSFATAADEAALRTDIEDSDAENLAFVVANGIKSSLEPCSDKIYSRRRAMFDSAQNGLIVSLTADDWSECKNSSGKSAAVERLNRIRELVFVGEFSIGASKIPLLRQSSSPKFRSYGENVRWEVNNIMFATVNLPANNNNYLPAAGRNSEFEDRLMANQDWLQRVVSYAAHKKSNGIVLFCDGNPLASPIDDNNKRDGFFEVRRQIIALATKFPGKILIIHDQKNLSQPPLNSIEWRGNIGVLGVPKAWSKITVSPSTPTLFLVGDSANESKNSRQ